jgi:hypothetical protein
MSVEPHEIGDAATLRIPTQIALNSFLSKDSGKRFKHVHCRALAAIEN